MADDHVEIGRQFGIFFRRADRFYARLRASPEGLDLGRGEYILLGRVAGGGPTRLSALADDVCLDLSTVSRQVGALEAAGLVARRPDPSDRRAVLVEATPTGFEVFARNRELWQSALRDLFADWSPRDRSEFTRLFTRFNESMAQLAQANLGQERK